MTLSPNLIPKKNQLDDRHPWLLLVKFALYEGETNEIIYLFVRNYPDTVYKGDTYKGFNFHVGMIRESTEGKVPSVSISISNVTQYLQATLEAYSGATAGTITFTSVHKDLLEEEYDSVEFDIIAPHVDANIISFRLGIPSPLKHRFPLHRYLSGGCPHKFKGARCGYTGLDLDCDRRYSACKAKNNIVRFGGVPGLM